MADHGIKWAAIGAVWQDFKKGKHTVRRINSIDMCKRITDELVNRNIVTFLWGYPWKGRHAEFVHMMEQASVEAIMGWLLDPELGLKAKDEDHDGDRDDEDMEIVFALAKALFWTIISANPYRVIGFSSYGLPVGHPTFPWGAFAFKDGFNPLEECDFGSPQLYDEELSDIVRGLAMYKALGFDIIVPSYGTYKFARDENGKQIYPRLNYYEMKNHFHNFASVKDEYDIRAMIGWSEAQISAGAWKAIAEYSEIFI